MIVAFYLRLSLADGDCGKDGKDESNSIENQRLLLQDFTENHLDPDAETIEYVDDGFSGTNFDRPAFNSMIEDAKKQRFDTLIVKDLSRLGRDYIGVGDYIDQIFPVLRIRFIAINSNYDSNKYVGRTMGLDMTITNFINTLYCRDLSKKVKSGLQSKWRQRKCTSGVTPYGYVRDKTCKGGWAVDPEAAAVVRIIFDVAVHDWSLAMIAEKLNKEKIDPPAKYKRLRGTTNMAHIVSEKEELWDSNKVRTILQKYEYCGAQIHNKHTRIKVGHSNIRKVPKHEQIILEDMHEAIISKEDYFKAQSIYYTTGERSFKNTDDYPLKGKIRCGNCNLALVHRTNLYQPIFFCNHTLMAGSHSTCCKNQYNESHINHIVYTMLKNQLQLLISLGDRMEEQQSARPGTYSQRKKQIEKQIAIKRSDRIRKYEAYADNMISLDRYKKYKDKITTEIENLQKELEELRQAHEEEDSLISRADQFKEHSQTVFSGDKLTRDMVVQFIDTVYVYDKNHIEVRFLFHDLVEELAGKLG